MGTEGSPEATPIHSSGRDAGAVAAEAGVERLVLIHLHPRGGHEAVLAEARGVFAAAELGADLLAVDALVPRFQIGMDARRQAL